MPAPLSSGKSPLVKPLVMVRPEMVMLLSTNSSPLVSPMVPVTAKVIVSPSFAMASAWRNEPGPLSLVLVTVMVAPCARSATAKNSAMAIATGLIRGVILVFIGVGLIFLLVRQRRVWPRSWCRILDIFNRGIIKTGATARARSRDIDIPRSVNDHGVRYFFIAISRPVVAGNPLFLSRRIVLDRGIIISMRLIAEPHHIDVA